MLTFSRVGTKVRMSVCIKVPFHDERCFFFEWETASEVFAGLLTNELFKAYEEQRSKELREAYDTGYKDGRSKKAKANHY